MADSPGLFARDAGFRSPSAARRNGAVRLRLLFATSSGVPLATISPPRFAGFGADIDDVVGVGDDAEVVLDDDDGVAVVHEPVQHLEQLRHVGHVQADGRLFEEVERRFRLTILPHARGHRAARRRG